MILPGAPEISTAWNGRLAIQNSIDWPTEKKVVDYQLDMAFAWISEPLTNKSEYLKV